MNHFPSTSWGKPRNDSVDPYATFPIHQGRHNSNQIDAFSQGVQHTQSVSPTTHLLALALALDASAPPRSHYVVPLRRTLAVIFGHQSCQVIWALINLRPPVRQPIVTGTSVLAIKFNGGVMMAADNLASYGSLARFKDIKRLHAVGESTLVGASGDMADYQQVIKLLENQMISEQILDDGHVLSSSQIYEYLSNVMYSKRNKQDPFWNAFIVAGLEPGNVPFLSYVDLLGTTYSAPSLASGYGHHIAQPLLRKALERLGPEGEKALSEADARALLEQCMKVLFYRDARSINKFQIASVTSRGVEISESMKAPTEWSFAEGLRGYGNSDETY
ncbi:BQ2448_989 [Microbotryum intermedium]|uniref:BQ2448_989 protein n=1 Tax=Microbotryum intermedium TaxID=269621 RepID=A0A238FCJ6_9BASI|nr:BQ2448_989 [Microbotryum intermedium]